MWTIANAVALVFAHVIAYEVAYAVHSRFSQNPSQAKNQKNSSNKSKAIFQYLCMSKVYAEILGIGFPSCFRDFGP